ncbi:OmpA family protein [Sulfurimonas sp.]
MKRFLQLLLLSSFVTLSASSAIYSDPYMYDDSTLFVDGEFEKIIRFDAILFEDKQIKEGYEPILRTIVQRAKELQKTQTIKIRVIGHTDSVTDDANEMHNKSRTYITPFEELFEYSLDSNESKHLSKEYAQIIQDKIVDRGIKRDITSLEARSGFDPAYSDATSEGRELSNRVMVAIYVMKPEDIDSDRDGVYDRYDRCVGTPRNSKVDKNGCPVDSDRDGILDYKDKCNDTPDNIIVDKKGCPLDSDNDGIVDYKDRCLSTPKGLNVDPSGCPVKNTLNLNFKTNSDKILQNSYKEIKDFAKFLKENPSYKVEIIGHTDSIGKASLNMILSQKRAKSVKQALILEGISKDRIKTKGRGELDPLESNRTKEGRRANRRIEIRLFY